jgi:hypothetical protein
LRPRISGREASYVLELLNERSNALLAKRKEYAELNQEVLRLKQQLHQDVYKTIIVDKLPAKECALDIAKVSGNWKEEQLLTKLVKKFAKLSNQTIRP